MAFFSLLLFVLANFLNETVISMAANNVGAGTSKERICWNAVVILDAGRWPMEEEIDEIM